MPGIKVMNRLKAEEAKLAKEQEEAHGDFMKMKVVFEKRIQLYLRFQSEDDLTDLDRLMLSNKREWQMAHLLGLIEHKDVINKITDLTTRVYDLEKQQQAIAERLEELR